MEKQPTNEKTPKLKMFGKECKSEEKEEKEELCDIGSLLYEQSTASIGPSQLQLIDQEIMSRMRENDDRFEEHLEICPQCRSHCASSKH